MEIQKTNFYLDLRHQETGTLTYLVYLITSLRNRITRMSAFVFDDVNIGGKVYMSSEEIQIFFQSVFDKINFYAKVTQEFADHVINEAKMDAFQRSKNTSLRLLTFHFFRLLKAEMNYELHRRGEI